MNKKGFTLVEIMIEVLNIGLLAAIAIQNFIRSRKTTQMNACIDNMRVNAGVMEQAKKEGVAADDINDAVLFGADAYIKVTPKCAKNYMPYTKFDRPKCPAADRDHVLPSE